MDVYHIWCNLKSGVKDTDFSDAVVAYFEHLKADNLIHDWRMTRRKLGLGHPNLPEWHMTLDFESMSQMDNAFGNVASRADPIEGFHHAVNSKVEDVFFALYRDFPDSNRKRGEEKF